MISNFRFSIISLSLLIGVAAVPAAHAQASISSVDSGSIDNRVTSLERISNSQAQLLQQLQQQLSDTQSDIDALRGEIQQNSYQLNQVTERQKQIYQQIDSLSSSNTSSASTSSTANPDATEQAPAAASVGVQSGDANQDYNAAVDLILKQNKPEEAIGALQAWIKKYPDSTYQPNANYWLGQLNYNQGKRDDAGYYFATVVKKYPKSPKASEALLKIGVIMQDSKQMEKAKTAWQQVIQLYPGSAAAKTAQSRLAAQG